MEGFGGATGGAKAKCCIGLKTRPKCYISRIALPLVL